jgi:hypothetical protein
MGIIGMSTEDGGGVRRHYGRGSRFDRGRRFWARMEGHDDGKEPSLAAGPPGTNRPGALPARSSTIGRRKSLTSPSSRASSYIRYLAAKGSTANYVKLTAFRLTTLLDECTVRAGYTKNRKIATQPLRKDVAEILRDYLRDKPAGQPESGRGSGKRKPRP